MPTRLDPMTTSILWARLLAMVDEAAATLIRTRSSITAMTIESPGGGGYGEPAKRPDELITRDLEEGYVTSWPGRNGSGEP